MTELTPEQEKELKSIEESISTIKKNYKVLFALFQNQNNELQKNQLLLLRIQWLQEQCNYFATLVTYYINNRMNEIEEIQAKPMFFATQTAKEALNLERDNLRRLCFTITAIKNNQYKKTSYEAESDNIEGFLRIIKGKSSSIIFKIGIAITIVSAVIMMTAICMMAITVNSAPAIASYLLIGGGCTAAFGLILAGLSNLFEANKPILTNTAHFIASIYEFNLPNDENSLLSLISAV